MTRADKLIPGKWYRPDKDDIHWLKELNEPLGAIAKQLPRNSMFMVVEVRTNQVYSYIKLLQGEGIFWLSVFPFTAFFEMKAEEEEESE